jgi:hypothetical protein
MPRSTSRSSNTETDPTIVTWLHATRSKNNRRSFGVHIDSVILAPDLHVCEGPI